MRCFEFCTSHVFPQQDVLPTTTMTPTVKTSLLVFVLLVTVCSARYAHYHRADALEPFTLEEYLTGAFSQKGWSGTWISDDSFVFRNSSGDDIVKYNATTRTIEPYFEASILSKYTSASYTLSPDRRYLLIRYNPISIYRHSTTAQYAIYDLNIGVDYSVGEGEQLQLASWAPVGTGLVYVYTNDIYYISTPENVINPQRITSDGVEGVIYNGVPDWVYEEEVLGSGSALWFSPEGNRLAFAQFNDTDVDSFTYFKYGEPGSLDSQYPEPVVLKYPKVGRTNPTVSLKVAYLDNIAAGPNEIDVIPSNYLPADYVLFDVTWPTNDEVSAIVTNRVQNSARLRRCSILTNTCADESAFEEEKGWLDLTAPIYNSNGGGYLILLSQPEGDDSYKHLVHVAANGNVTRLTYGQRIVSGIYGWDEDHGLVYYYGPREGYPSQQHVYVVNTRTLDDTCLTCNYIVADGDTCLYAGASFSTDYSYFAKVCQGRGPYYITIDNALDSSDSVLWEDNAAIRAQLSKKLRPDIVDVDVELESGFVAKARLYVPPNIDDSGFVKYPAVVQVYGGPGSNRISDAFSVGFLDYIVTSRRYIYIQIDGRGTDKKGNNLLFQIYRKLGTVEIEDQIAVTKCLQETYPFIDPLRTGIWGWSYGGFAAAWVLAKDSEGVFAFATSVAPVTDFIYYDSIYTERYMGLPTEEDNLQGYNNTDIAHYAECFRGKNFQLIHGNGDDNVHYQQSMLLAKALERADIQFQQISYPDEAHSLSGVYAHLYHSIDRFWARSFGLPDPPIVRLLRRDEIEG